MKLKHVGMIVVSVLAMSSAAVSAAEGDESVTTTVNGGVIHFKGEVVNAACAIDSESMNQTVELGQVRSSRLAKAGDLSSAVGFNIKLNDCDTNSSEIETGCVWHGYAHPSNLPIFISFLMRNGLYLERYEKSHNI